MKQYLKNTWRRELMALLGTLIYCLGINLFVVPAGLYTSGLLGFCQVLRSVLEQYCHISFGQMDVSGLIYYVVNIPILLLAWSRIGRVFVLRTLLFVSWSVLLLSVIPTVPLLPGDTLTASVLGGVVAGLGVGLGLRSGMTLGGVDTVALMILRRRKNFSVGGLNLALNLLVYGGCMVLFDIPTAIYSVVSAVVYSAAVDRVHTQNIDVEVTIITKADAATLEQEIFHQLERGVTQLQGVGAYTREGVSVLLVVLSKYEVPLLRQIVHEKDSNAFVIMKDHVRIYGNYDRRLS